jgi:hypothetical protein
MADLKPFEARLKGRPNASYDRDQIPRWEAADKNLHAALDDVEHARRDAEALREQLAVAAKRVAELEFEVERLRTTLELREAVQISVASAPAVPGGESND